MSTFEDIPIRSNDDVVEAGWFNALRAAGVTLQGSSGSGNIVRNTSIVGLVTVDVDESLDTPQFIEFEYAYSRDHDDDDTDVLRERGIIRVPYESPFTTIGEIERTVTQSQNSLGFSTGVTFSITSNLVSSVRTIGLDVQVSDSGAVAPTVQGKVFAIVKKVII